MKKLLAMAAAGLFLGTASTYAQSTQLVGMTNALWKYMGDNSDQYSLGFPNLDDSTWPEGRGLFGNDSGYPYPFVTTVPGGITSYYRTRFNFSGGVSGVVLTMTNHIDDGIIIYLNGTEIVRYNMVDAAPTATHGSLAAAANPLGEPVRIVHQISLDSLTNGALNPLVPGQNILAASVHNNNTTSSDTVFGLSLNSARLVAPCSPPIVPTSTNVTRCRTVTFALTIPSECGVPNPTYQWFKDGSPVVGQTGTSLSITNVQDGDAGNYYAELSNGVGAPVRSGVATLNVSADNAGPQIVNVVGVSGQPNQFLATFDEPVQDPGGATDAFTWSISSVEEVPVTFAAISAVIQANPAQVLITTDGNREAGKRYGYLTTQPIEDACAGNATAEGLNGAVLLQEPILDYSDSKIWRVDDTATDRGTAWVASNYDDSAWRTGQQMFDRSRGDLARAVVAGQAVRTFLELTNWAANPPTNVSSYYLRVKVPVPAGTVRLTGFPIYDDGYIIYVNGTEVHRTNVVATADQFAVYGGGGAINAGDAARLAPFEIPISLAPAGTTATIAVLLKQNDGTSSDVTFGLRILATAPGFAIDPIAIITQPTPQAVTEGHTLRLSVAASGSDPSYQWYKDGVAIDGATSATYTKTAVAADTGDYRCDVSNPAGTVPSATVRVSVRPVVAGYNASWKYEINSQDGTAWFAPGFDDSAWQSGPGPFGVDTSAAFVARTPVPIATALPVPSATFLTAYFRTTVTVPAVPANQSLVLNHLVDDGVIFYVDGVRVLEYNAPTNPPPTLSTHLAPANAPGDGDARVVSVPVSIPAGNHVIAAEVHQSSATSSDVVFGAELQIVPKLTIVRSGGNVTVTWGSVTGFSLYSAPSVTGPWTAVAGATSPLNAAATGEAKFYQLR